jgi:hypothetical protein
MSLFKTQLEKIDKRLLKEPFFGSDAAHPILGSFDLLHYLQKHKERFKGKWLVYRYIYQLAALGIFTHHREVEIDFQDNPFGYLLLLADTLHEWQRYLCVGTTGRGDSRLAFRSPITSLEIIGKEDRLFGLKYKRNPKWAHPALWDSKTFRECKEEELKRLKKDTKVPRFILA